MAAPGLAAGGQQLVRLLAPLAGMQGYLHRYGPRPVHVAFISPPQAPSAAKHLVLIHGMTEGLLYATYVPTVTRALQAAGWSVVQAQHSGSYNGWGCGSLDEDAADLLLLVRWLREQQQAQHVVLLGHSTGANDIVRVMQKLARGGGGVDDNHGALSVLRGTVLQGPVSDREIMGPSMSEHADRAARMVAEGAGEEVAHRYDPQGGLYGAALSARRLHALVARLGDDDMFSADLTDAELQGILGPVGRRPCLLVCSGADEYVLPSVRQAYAQHAQRMGRAIAAGGHAPRVEVVEGANHAMDEHGDVLARLVADFAEACVREPR